MRPTRPRAGTGLWRMVIGSSQIQSFLRMSM